MAKDEEKNTTPQRGTRLKSGSTTSQDVSAADRASAEELRNTKNVRGGKIGLTGAPLGTPIYRGEAEVREDGRLRGTRTATGNTQYASGDGMRVLLGMNDQERSQLLSQLAQIPGVYPKGRAPSQAERLRLAQGGQGIPVTDLDAKALENVMRYADTLGITYDEATTALFNDPTSAAIFYGFEPTKGPKLLAEKSLVAEITDKFQNTFDVPVSDKIAKRYAAEVRAAQQKNPALSAQEREDIMFKYLEDASGELAKLSKQGADYQPRGVLGEYVTQLRQEYYDNGLPMDEDRIYRLAVKSLRDPQELVNSRQKIRQRAELVFPPLREYISRGESVRDVLSPYMRLKATIFEKNEADINPSDMYDVMEGDKLKNINDYKMSLYRSPEYKKTQGYFQRELSDTRGLLQYLGIE